MGRNLYRSRRMSERKETGAPPGFRLIGVHRKRFRSPAAGMNRVISTPAHGSSRPGVDNVEHQRSLHRNGGVQTGWRLPRAIAHAGHPLAVLACELQRHATAVTGDDVTPVGEAFHLYLDA